MSAMEMWWCCGGGFVVVVGASVVAGIVVGGGSADVDVGSIGVVVDVVGCPGVPVHAAARSRMATADRPDRLANGMYPPSNLK